jgi:predicted ATP-grasp superfamily ATP-dependent carboligase
MAVSDRVIDIQVSKIGASGRPSAVVTAAESVSLDKLVAGIQKGLTRNTDLRKKLGLKACTGCAASGIDIDIRHRYDIVLQAELG